MTAASTARELRLLHRLGGTAGRATEDPRTAPPPAVPYASRLGDHGTQVHKLGLAVGSSPDRLAVRFVDELLTSPRTQKIPLVVQAEKAGATPGAPAGGQDRRTGSTHPPIRERREKRVT